MANSYPVNIPSYENVADIRRAFNLYHYGIETEPDEDYEIQPQSVSGYLDNVLSALATAQNRLTEIDQIDPDSDLNDQLTNGIFLSEDSPTTENNYPSAKKGLLNVVSISPIEGNPPTITFQTYQAIETNNYWWRSGVLTAGNRVWTSWASASKVGHTHPEYLTTTSFNTKVDSSMATSSATVTDATGKIVSSPVTSNELAQLDGISLGQTIQDQLNDKAALAHNHNDLYHLKSDQPRVYVQSSTPSGASVGDLWFW